MNITMNSDYFLTMCFGGGALLLFVGGAVEYARKGGSADMIKETRTLRKENEKLREIIYDFTKHPVVRTSPTNAVTSRRLSAVKP